ncbi:hypothetical protein J6A31_08680, partial [bacterium]|nr:hypothetical protein [bacterium]
SNAMVIECRQFTGSPGWSENTASMSGFVNNSYVGEIYDTQTVSYANGVNKSHVYSFDITVAVKEWINSSTKRGCGLIFKAANETTVQSKTFASYERANYQPTFSMTYIDNTGAFTWIYLDNLIGEEYSGGMYTPNCFGYAMGVDNTIDIGQGFNPNTNYIYHFANDVEEYINNSVARRTVVKKFTGDWRSYKLEFNQYLVAIRVGNNSNYHFKVQINDGRWTEKNSYYPATEPSYYDPNLSVNWNSAYTSQTMFLVIEVG